MLFRDVAEAAKRIQPWIRRTPVIRAKGPGARPVVFKLEGQQRSGSFKIRGALNKLMVLGDAARAGVITASGGNHGLGVATAGWFLNIPVTVFVPSTTPPVKRAALERAAAEVRVIEGDYPHAAYEAQREAEALGLAYVPTYDDRDVVAGQGTCIAEMLEDAPDVATVVVAIGGGGLASGAVLAANGRRVVGVEPFGAPTMHAALRAGGPVTLDYIDTVTADALGAGRVGDVNFALCREGLDRVELVEDQAVLDARRWLWEQLRLVVEPGAAVGIAALAAGLLDDDPGPIGIILCGANTDPATLS
jgi:threonine dehydratase